MRASLRRFVFFFTFPLAFFQAIAAPQGTAGDGMSFWAQQRKGANFFNAVPTRERIEAAGEVGIEFIRLAPNKWKSNERDFLLGDAGEFRALVEEDLGRVRQFLDDAHEVGLKVVLTMLNLPGSRWRQQNDGKDDLRLWREPKYAQQAAEFWRQLAARLKGHPALVAYNLLNEPHPERASGFDDFWAQPFRAWYEKAAGTAADLNRFNRQLVAAIRAVDATTPIVIESGLYATPWAFEYLEPVDDANTLYSFHMYEPYEYTTHRINQGRFAYPGAVPVGGKQQRREWNREELRKFLQPVVDWSRRHKIAPHRVVVGEFGVDRRTKGAAAYLADLVSLFNEQGWHWAFYAFREDTWDAMDYELGSGPLGGAYWKAVEAGENPEPPRKPNPLFEVLRREFRPRQ